MKALLSLILASLLLAACAPDEPAPADDGARAALEQEDAALAERRRIHADTVTLDTHVDIDLEYATEAIDPLDADIQVNLRKMRQGGLDAAFFIVYVGQTERTPENYARAQADAMTKFDAIHRMTDELYPDLIGLAYTADDFDRLAGEGKLIAAIGIENGYVIGKDLDLLDRYYALGARYMTLVHNGHNDIAESAQPRPQLGDEPTAYDGVSDFGAAVIERMNALGMMVDVSHASKATALEAIQLSRAPVIASHSSTRAVADHVRNMDDETLMALSQSGGVIQIVAYDSYVKVRPPEYAAGLSELQERLNVSAGLSAEQVTALPDELRFEYLRGIGELNERYPPSNVADFVDHVDHAVELIGIDHVGISSDFGGGGGIVGWTDALETPSITYELLDRGYSEDDIRKLWSGNLLRVWREVERVAAELESAASAAASASD